MSQTASNHCDRKVLCAHCTFLILASWERNVSIIKTNILNIFVICISPNYFFVPNIFYLFQGPSPGHHFALSGFGKTFTYLCTMQETGDLLSIKQFSLAIPGEKQVIVLLNNIELSIQPGSFVTLTGRSGWKVGLSQKSGRTLPCQSAKAAGTVCLKAGAHFQLPFWEKNRHGFPAKLPNLLTRWWNVANSWPKW